MIPYTRICCQYAQLLKYCEYIVFFHSRTTAGFPVKSKIRVTRIFSIIPRSAFLVSRS